MLFRVIAQEPADYETWLAHEALPAVQPGGGEAAAGSVRFRQLTCANCHNISGVNPQSQYAPDLTHMGSREALDGERVKNTPQELREWLHEPNIVKPGCLMPNLNLSDQDLTQLTAYLESLK
jgi:cytochrome c oxidase subunit 2